MSDDPAHSAPSAYGVEDVDGSDSSGAAGAQRPRRPSRDDEPVLPTTTQDEREVGWGDEATRRDEDWYRRERPPHHE